MSTKVKPIRVAGYTRDDKGMSFEEVTEAFLRSRRLGLGTANHPNSERTVFEYRYDLEKFFAKMRENGHTHYNDIKRGDFEDFIEYHQGRKELAKSSKMKVLRSLKSFMRWMAQDADCQRSGMTAWTRELPKIPKNDVKLFIPAPHIMHKMVESFDKGFRWGLRDYVVSCLILDCGARISEVCNLKPSSVKFEVNMILLEGKTGTRLVPISGDAIVPLIRRWMREREHFSKTEWLFHNKYGGKATPNMFDQSFARQRKLLNMQDEDHITPHTLRHYFCTHYLVNGGTLHGLKEITGHDSFDTLQIYVHLANQIKFVKEDHGKASPLKTLGNDVQQYGNKGVAKKKRKVV